MAVTPNVSYSFVIRLEIPQRIGMLAQVMQTISEAGGDVDAIDIVKATSTVITREITVSASDEEHARLIIQKVCENPDLKVINISDRTFQMHQGGKISVIGKFAISTRDQLSMAYTPGVARVCLAIAEDKNKAFSLTAKANLVAIVTDGSAVLGLGNIGPEAAMPVMEGKAMLFKEFGDVNAVPICMATQDTAQIIQTVKNLAPGFGGINLEDISAPRCFEIEDRLSEELDIPVMHDDQHGTAVVVLAALLNALKLTGRSIEKIKVVVVGLGAAGTASAKMIAAAGCRNIVGVDKEGAIYRGMPGQLTTSMQWFAEHTNPDRAKGSLADVIEGADVFLGVSGPGVLKAEYLKKMRPRPIVFALANPTPEILPEEARPFVEVIATGRSDYPNQINNVLSFPGIFRGALDSRATRINEALKLAAARAIQGIVSDEELSADYIIPSVFDRRVGKAVSQAVMAAAIKSGVARTLDNSLAPSRITAPSNLIEKAPGV